MKVQRVHTPPGQSLTAERHREVGVGENLMDNDLPNDAVEMVRAIRDRHYEETKSMTLEEKWAYDQKGIDEFKKLMQEVNPNDYDFSWLHRK